MDLVDKLREIGARAANAQHLKTEEATKMALVVPFIQALGYDVYNPLEVEPEFTADAVGKKGEKVDYAIRAEGPDGEPGPPKLLIECKQVGADLSRDKERDQLYRYFTVTKARIGVLTNGIEYRFFSDLDSANLMDHRPFLVFRIDDVNEDLVNQLKQFTKSAWNIDTLLDSAERLKYSRAIKALLARQMQNPDENFVRYIGGEVYEGRLGKNMRERLSGIIKQAFREFINERIGDRFKVAAALDDASEETTPEQLVDAVVEQAEAEPTPPGVVAVDGDIVTTVEERDAFLIVKAICAEIVDPDRIHMRDTKSYCGVLLDDNNRKPVCRLRFNAASVMYLGLFDADKNETKVEIESVRDVYRHAESIRAAVRGYLDWPASSASHSSASRRIVRTTTSGRRGSRASRRWRSS